jgi:hypothetical protein
MLQSDQTPSRAFPRTLACPICPPRRGGDLLVYAIDVDARVDPQHVIMRHVCRRCDHSFALCYALGPEGRWEFSLQMGECPPTCAVVHGLYGEAYL